MKKIPQILLFDKVEFLPYFRDGKLWIPIPHLRDLIGVHIERNKIPNVKFTIILKSIVLDFID